MSIREAPPVNDREHQELRMLYSISADEIAHLKRRQLNVTNYAVVLYMVLVVIAKQVIIQPAAASWKLVVLSFIAVMVALAGMLALSQLQHLVGIRRNRLRAVRERFSKAFHTTWGEAETGDDNLVFHRAVILAGAIICVYLIGFDT